MNIKSVIAQAAALSFATAAVGAYADSYHFDLTGASTVSFDLPSSPTPDDAMDSGFTLDNIQGMFAGENRVVNLYFYIPGPAGGGFVSSNTSETYNNLFGDQLFTGTTTAPTFKLGTFDLHANAPDGDAATLAISAVAAVPEPASVSLMLAGLGAVGAFAARRRKASGKQAITA